MRNIIYCVFLAYEITIFFLHASETKRPNILFIFTDDQTYRSLSCYENSYVYAKTPNIDTLAQKGVRFTQAIVGAKCVNSRASILTGKLQFNIIGKENRYWTEDFRNSGYYTGMIGKWHWGKGSEMHQHGTAWDWSVIWDHGQKAEKKTYYWGQSVNINGGPPERLDGYSTDRYTEFAKNFINQQKSTEKPWLLWFCYGAVHGPYTPAKRHLNVYKSKPITKTPKDIYGPRKGKPDYLTEFSLWEDNENGEPTHQNITLDSWVKKYNEAVISIDEGVGQIVKLLKKNGQLKNTIIIFTSDQGYAWGQHGLKDKRYPYIDNLKSPLIISWPDHYAQGKVCHHPVNGPDIIKTIHSISKVEPMIKLDGRNFSDLLINPNHDSWSHEGMIQTYLGDIYDQKKVKQALINQKWSDLIYENKSQAPSWIMLHKGRFKYTRYLAKDCIEEIYDLDKDPYEYKNLAVHSEYKTLLESMRQEAIDTFKARGAKFMNYLPKPTRN